MPQTNELKITYLGGPDTICDASQRKVPYVGQAYLEILSKITSFFFPFFFKVILQNVKRMNNDDNGMMKYRNLMGNWA